MKERPILFSAPMVRALLDDSKTQTRRIMNPQPRQLNPGNPEGYYELNHKGGYILSSARNGFPAFVENCPYGQPGDRLWVREAWASVFAEPVEQMMPPDIAFRADGGEKPAWLRVWRPSIHMPRWASRITLEVTGVRVERLQDISEADAIAEGSITSESQIAIAACRNQMAAPDVVSASDGKAYANARRAYRALWEQINGAGSWEANPWVWVIEFKRVQP